MPKRIVKVKSVIFDMDGVITDTMPDHYKAWQCALEEHGIIASHEDIYSREGQSGLQSVQEIFNKYGKPHTMRKSRMILNRKEEVFKKMSHVRYIQGARSFIRSLSNNNFLLALVTGTSRHEMEKILPPLIYDCFKVSVTGCEVRNGKPYPEPYLKAMDKMGLKQQDAIVIENAPFGIRSAKAAGLRVFALETSLPRKFLDEADAVFSSIKDLVNKVHFDHV